VEKSCRIMVRSSIEQVFNRDKEAGASCLGRKAAVSTNKSDLQMYCRSTELSSPAATNPVHFPTLSSRAAIVTPRIKSPPPTICGREDHTKTGLLPIPDDFDDKRVHPHRITPQPRSPEPTLINFTPTTPVQNVMDVSSPSLVSPPAANRTLDYSRTDLALGPRDRGPNLPVLVEVACAAMREA